MISCNQHDYIEIACIYHYPIKLTLKSGDIIQGIALDTQHNDKRDECLKFDIDGVEQLVVLKEVKILEVLVENPYFRLAEFD